MGKRFYHFMCGVIRPYYSVVYPEIGRAHV